MGEYTSKQVDAGERGCSLSHFHAFTLSHFLSPRYSPSMRVPHLWSLAIALILPAFVCCLGSVASEQWPQFRGPDGRSLGGATARPPIQFGVQSNVVWKIALPAGHSSPCIWGNRVFLTATDHDRLETICVDRSNGKILWTKEAPGEKLEPTHRISNPAASTPCTDGERVYVYFGSCGLICYNFDGEQIWKRSLPTPMTEFGGGTSPVLAGELLVLIRDGDLNSELLAVNKTDGKTVWKTDRSEFRRSFASPWGLKGKGENALIVPGSLWLKAYNARNGKELWMVRGFARVANASPTSGDGLIFLSSWNVGGDSDDRVSMAPWADFLAAQDKNNDGILTRDEFPPGPVLERFTQIDLDKDGRVTKDEYENMRMMFDKAENAVVAIRPGGEGDVTATHVAWRSHRALPYVSSPLYYDGYIYTVKSGGLASCYDAKSGAVHYQAERMGAPGDYYASAVGVNNTVYYVSQNGVVTVLAAGKEFKILAQHDLGEMVFATPAFVGDKIYIRTAGHLYAFGNLARYAALSIFKVQKI